MITNIRYRKAVLIILFACILLSCKKEENIPIDIPIVSTVEVMDVMSNSAKSGGIIVQTGGGTISSRGIVWCTTANPTYENNEGFTADGSGTGIFESKLDNLLPVHSYTVRAYAINDAGIAYGDKEMFTTLLDDSSIPFVRVDFHIRIGTTQYIELNHITGYAYFTGGWRGIIVYRSSETEFKAYDRACPNHPNKQEAFIRHHDNSTVICNHCSSVFSLENGSIVNKIGLHPLRKYKTYYNDPYLQVTNY